MSGPAERLANDILYALSMYFAATLKAQLMASHEHVGALVLVAALFALHVKGVDAWWRQHYHRPTETGTATLSLFMAVVEEAVYLITRTLAFLLLQVVIHVVAEGNASTASTGFWHEAVVLPCLLLVLGMVVVAVVKTYDHPASKRGTGGK